MAAGLPCAPKPERGSEGLVKKRRTLSWNVAISTGENVRRSLPRVAREFFESGRTAAAPAATPVQLHAFRLAAKRFRYSLELFLVLYGPRLTERVEQVRRIQSMLGDRQDCVVLAERLRKSVRKGGLVDEILQKLDAEGKALEEKFRHYWHGTFDAPGVEAAWRRYLSRRLAAPRRTLHDIPFPTT